MKDLSVRGLESIGDIASNFILLAELFGSGERDARGYTTKSNFVARRGNVHIAYKEESGQNYVSGELIVSDSGKVVLSAERSIEEPDFEAGFGVCNLGYKTRIYDPPAARDACHSFIKGLKLIGERGMILPMISGKRE